MECILNDKGKCVAALRSQTILDEQVYKKGKTVYATTEDLASLSQLNTNAVQEIYLLTGIQCVPACSDD